MKKPSLIASFTIPGAWGPKDIHAFFPGKKVVTDRFFHAHYWKDGIRFQLEEGLNCQISQTEGKEEKLDDVIMAEMGMLANLTPNDIALLLRYLGDAGSSFLFIPEGEEETNIVLGYAYIGGHRKVVYVEHEHGNEIHLHAKDVNRWNGKSPMVISIATD